MPRFIFAIVVISMCALQSCCYKSDCSGINSFAIPVDCSNLPANERSNIIVYAADKLNGNIRDSANYADPYMLYIPVSSLPDHTDGRNYSYIIKLATGRQDTVYNVNYELSTYHCNSCLWNKGSLEYNIQNPEYWYRRQKYTNGNPVVLLP